MTSYWPTLCRIVDGVEGISGITLNIVVIYIILRRTLTDNLFNYRVCITTTAVQGAFFSALIPLFEMAVHMCRENRFITTFFGPVSLLPSNYSNILIALYIFFGIGLWNFVPAASMLQYLALCRPHFCTMTRLAIAYGPCLLLQLWIIPYCTTFSTSPQLQQQYLSDVAEVYNLTVNDRFVVIGGLMEKTRENPICIWKILSEGIAPSYSIAYFLFAFASGAVYRDLSKFGVRLSAKTALMQERFLITLVLQGMLPLAAVFFPLSILFFGLLGGQEMMKLSSLIGFSFYLVPIIQACVSLSFVVRGLRSSSAASSKESRTRKS